MSFYILFTKHFFKVKIIKTKKPHQKSIANFGNAPEHFAESTTSTRM